MVYIFIFIFKVHTLSTILMSIVFNLVSLNYGCQIKIKITDEGLEYIFYGLSKTI